MCRIEVCRIFPVTFALSIGCAAALNSTQLTTQADKELDACHYAAARDSYLKVLRDPKVQQDKPLYASVLYDLTKCYIRLDDVRNAESCFQQLKQTHPPERLRALMDRHESSIALMHKDYKKVETLDQKLLTVPHSDPIERISTIQHLAIAQLGLREYSDSEKNLKTVIHEATTLPDFHRDGLLQQSYHLLGLVYRRTGHPVEAIESMKTGIQIINTSKENICTSAEVVNDLSDLAGAQREAKMYDDALKTFDHAFQISKKNTQDRIDYLGGSGCVYFDRGDYVKAEESFNDALSLCKGPTLATYGNLGQYIANLACIYAKTNRPKLATKYFNIAHDLADRSQDLDLQKNIEFEKKQFGF